MKLQLITTIAILVSLKSSINAQQSFRAIFSSHWQVTYSLQTEDFILEVDSAGKVAGFTARGLGKIIYGVNGRIEKIGEHTVKRDYLNMVSAIGNSRIDYDMENRIITAGANKLTYDFISKRLNNINKEPVIYDFLSGRVTRIASAVITYGIDGNVQQIYDKENILSLRIHADTKREL